MRSIRDIPVLHDIPVLVRAALNVPFVDGEIADDYRLRHALPTLRFLSDQGARVVVVSHIGSLGTETLAPVARALGKLIPRVSFSPETVGPRARAAIRELRAGNILVMENLRRDRGEKMNDPAFANELAALADVFVEDSFDTCHRMHASIVGVPKILPSYAGLQLEKEVRELSVAFSSKHPALAVIGGAKFSTKEAVLTTLLQTYDHVFVGGALASDFLKAGGHEIGKSLTSNLGDEGVEKMLGDKRIVLPMDALVIPFEKLNSPDARKCARVVAISNVEKNDVILDHGPATTALLSNLAQKAKTILWNGPLGNYENGFIDATDDFARAIAKSSAHSIVGGGDTVASIENLGLMSHFSFVSTGGGAMLDFLATGTLPGIEVLT